MKTAALIASVLLYYVFLLAVGVITVYTARLPHGQKLRNARALFVATMIRARQNRVSTSQGVHRRKALILLCPPSSL